MNAQLRKLVGDLVRAFRNPPALEVVFTVPARADEDRVARAAGGLADVFARTARELGIDREIHVLVQRRIDDLAVVEVSADQRPVAIFSSPLGAAGWPAAVCASTRDALLRRARVLLDGETAQRAGRLLSGAVTDEPGGNIRRTLEYLLDNGVSLARLGSGPPFERPFSPCEAAELLINSVAPRDVRIDLPEPALRRTTEEQRNSLVDFRIAAHDECGARFPDLVITSHDVAPDEVRIRLNDVLVPRSTTGDPATFSDVVAASAPSLTEHAAWLLRMDDVEAQRSELDAAIPELGRLSRTQVPTWLLCACLRSLLANADSVRNLPRIVWLLLEFEVPRDGADEVVLPKPATEGLAGTTDPEALASTVRRLIAYEAWAGGESLDDDAMTSVPIEWEAALVNAGDDLLGPAEWQIARAAFAADRPATVVAHTVAAIGPLRQALRALPEPPRVIASQELPPASPLPPVFEAPRTARRASKW
ncbi:hypothetical protein ACWEGE_21340 [Amycolatopsis sp. NPDC004747]